MNDGPACPRAEQGFPKSLYLLGANEFIGCVAEDVLAGNLCFPQIRIVEDMHAGSLLFLEMCSRGYARGEPFLIQVCEHPRRVVSTSQSTKGDPFGYKRSPLSRRRGNVKCQKTNYWIGNVKRCFN